MSNPIRTVLLILLSALACAPSLSAAETGGLTLRVIDDETKLTIPARIHLRNAQDQPVVPKNAPHWADHFAINGEITLDLPAGDYTFELECGPEYKFREGKFTIEADAEGTRELSMERFFNMGKQGWFAGDVLTYRRRNDMELWMRIEGLTAVFSAGFERGTVLGDEPREPLAVENFLKHGTSFSAPTRASRFAGGQFTVWFDRGQEMPESPPASDLLGVDSLRALTDIRGTFATALSPVEWDLPLWIPTQGLEGVLVAHPGMTRDKMLELEATQRPRPAGRYQGAQGLGRYSLDSYFTLLNAGVKLVPMGGSGSGMNDNPLGYCRTYVYCAPKYTPEIWYANLRAGKVMVTNGPLMTPRVNGQLPGHTFRAKKGGTLALRPEMNLATREKIDYVEIIKDGKVVEEIRLDKWAEANGRLPEIAFDRSGWMAVRVVTGNAEQYRFAMSGPFFVEIGGKKEPDRDAVESVLEWIDSRPAANAEANEAYHAEAQRVKEFWQRQLDSAVER